MTPWQRVHKKFGLTAAGLAKLIGRHRSKVSRALKDEHGLINGSDQELLIRAADSTGVDLTPEDLLPGR